MSVIEISNVADFHYISLYDAQQVNYLSLLVLHKMYFKHPVYYNCLSNNRAKNL